MSYARVPYKRCALKLRVSAEQGFYFALRLAAVGVVKVAPSIWMAVGLAAGFLGSFCCCLMFH